MNVFCDSDSHICSCILFYCCHHAFVVYSFVQLRLTPEHLEMKSVLQVTQQDGQGLLWSKLEVDNITILSWNCYVVYHSNRYQNKNFSIIILWTRYYRQYCDYHKILMVIIFYLQHQWNYYIFLQLRCYYSTVTVSLNDIVTRW